MEWTRGHTLGRGSTAAVYTAEAKISGEVFAVKSAELHRSEFLQREQGIHSTLNCPQIVAYQGCDVTFENGAQWFNLFMEYAPYGTLADMVRDGNGMEEALAGCYTRQILMGLHYLHSNGIVHCDVKGQNVLVTDQGVKIADLGCALRMSQECGGRVIAGTPAFMAPEVARGEEQGFPADVWALGCTVLEMITGKPPWHGVSDPVSVLYGVGFSGEVPEIPRFVSEQGRDFLSKCLKRDPCERWKVEELLEHGFVRDQSNLVCKEFGLGLGSSDWDTPTGVLERGLWDSLEIAQDPTRGGCSWDSPSPSDRIRRLCDDEHVWDWDDVDDRWVTVRSNEVNENELEMEGLLSIPNGQGSTEEEIENCGLDSVSIIGGENGLVIFDELKIVDVNVFRLSRLNIISDYCYLSSSYCGCWIRDSLLFWIDVRDSLLSGCPCLNVVPHGRFDSQNKEIFILLRFLLSLSVFNSTLDRLNTVHFKIIMDSV